MEDENQVIPTAEEQETVETEAETVESTEEDRIKQLEQVAHNQKKRAEKAEAELKALRENAPKSAKSEKTEKQITSNHDETFVISALGAKGLSFDEISTYVEKARKIAQVEDIPLAKALDTDYFKTFDKQFQDEKKQELASVGASRGSGGSVNKKNLQTPGLSDQEFQDMLKSKLRGE